MRSRTITAKLSGTPRHTPALASTCGGWRRVQGGVSSRLTDRGVRHVCAVECGVRGCVRGMYSGGMGRDRGVWHAVWGERRMRARLAGLRVPQVAHALCHIEGEDAGKTLQNCWQYGSIKRSSCCGRLCAPQVRGRHVQTSGERDDTCSPSGHTGSWSVCLMVPYDADTERTPSPPSRLYLPWPPCGPSALKRLGMQR